MKISAIIAAAGLGKRTGLKGGKQFFKLLGKPLLFWTVRPFEECRLISEIILVINKIDKLKAEHLIKKFKFSKTKIALGGKERSNSVENGLKLVSKGAEIVLIHDGARPLITKDLIEKSIREAEISGASVLGVPVHDTIKKVGKNHTILETPNRKGLWQAQTPQGFKYEIITKAYKNALRAMIKATDDSSVVEKLGKKVKMIIGSKENIKVTTKEDLKVAEAILRMRGKKK